MATLTASLPVMQPGCVESGGADVDGDTSAAITDESATETGSAAADQAASGEPSAVDKLRQVLPQLLARPSMWTTHCPVWRSRQRKSKSRPGPREGAYNRSEAQLAAARACGRDLVGASKFIGVTALPAGGTKRRSL